jgi:phosphoribosylaminoimidazolecarboxamide formyltransferase/IMP cyclohydrolase
MKSAILSVSDKTGIVSFAEGLAALGFRIISTGGTLSALLKAGVAAVNVSEVTGFKECLGGRVKTLHPAVHAGILAMRDDPEHMRHISELGYGTVDVVAVNLYPFKETIEKPDVRLGDAVENIDIGGPTMLRSAAKNYRDVYSVCDPKDYGAVLEDIEAGGNSDLKFRLMRKVFQHTAVYDSMISNYLGEKLNETFPEKLTLAFEKKQEMRYGENPTQKGAFYQEIFSFPGALREAVQLAGKELSYNNIGDADAALNVLREFKGPAAVAVKHTNPCGIGIADDIYEAYLKAYESDPVSIYGGIVALNSPVCKKTAEKLAEIFLEIVIAPDFSEEAVKVFAEKRKNVRLLKLPSINSPLKKGSLDMRRVAGGLLVQEYDDSLYNKDEYKVVTKKAPTEEEKIALDFAFKVVKHTKSNAIVVSGADRTFGIGMGQTNRIWAAEEALSRAGKNAKGAVMASDAFFPFPDCVEAASKYGISAIIQPGGSVNDQKSIEAADKAGIAMVFTGTRHFKH